MERKYEKKNSCCYRREIRRAYNYYILLINLITRILPFFFLKLILATTNVIYGIIVNR